MCVCICSFFNFIIAKLNTVKFVCLYVAHSRPQKTTTANRICVLPMYVSVCEMKTERKNQNKKSIYEKKSAQHQQQQRNINK